MSTPMPQPMVRSVLQQTHDLLRARVIALREQGVHKLPSEPALAAEMGVSRVTVRRALAELARERLVDRQTGRGTFIRPNARMETVSLLVHGEPTLRFSPSLASTLYGALLEIREGRGEVRFDGIPDAHAGGIADRLIRQARSLRCDGYVAGLSLPLEECLKVVRADIPLVATLSDFGCDDVPTVLIDHYAVGAMAGRLMAENGRRRTALVSRAVEGDSLCVSRRILEGLRSVLGDRAPEPERMVEATGYSPHEARDAVRRLLDMPEPPDAILVTSDERTRGAVEALSERGLDGLGTPLLVPYLQTPEIAPGTCVLTPSHERIGREAVRMVRRLIAGERLENRVRFIRPQLVERARATRRN